MAGGLADGWWIRAAPSDRCAVSSQVYSMSRESADASVEIVPNNLDRLIYIDDSGHPASGLVIIDRRIAVFGSATVA